jgi:hypothetical protein
MMLSSQSPAGQAVVHLPGKRAESNRKRAAAVWNVIGPQLQGEAIRRNYEPLCEYNDDIVCMAVVIDKECGELRDPLVVDALKKYYKITGVQVFSDSAIIMMCRVEAVYLRRLKQNADDVWKVLAPNLAKALFNHVSKDEDRGTVSIRLKLSQAEYGLGDARLVHELKQTYPIMDAIPSGAFDGYTVISVTYEAASQLIKDTNTFNSPSSSPTFALEGLFPEK